MSPWHPSQIFAASARAPFQPKADFDCTDVGSFQQQPMGQNKLSRRQKMTICCSIACACVGGMMIGVAAFDTADNSHFQGSRKFVMPHTRPLSGHVHPGVTTPSDLAAPMVPVIGNEDSQLSQLQAQVEELEHMLEERQAHQPEQGITGFFGAFLAFLGMGMGWAVMHAISGNSSSGYARSRLGVVTMQDAKEPSFMDKLNAAKNMFNPEMMQKYSQVGVKVQELQQELQGTEIECSTNEGAIVVTMSGTQTPISVTVSEATCGSGAEQAGADITAAFKEAHMKSGKYAQEKMSQLYADIGLAGMPGAPPPGQ